MFANFISFSQETDVAKKEDYALIYVYRLKKSTDSNVTFDVKFDDAVVGEFPGIGSAFSANYSGSWLVVKREKTGSCMIKIVNQKKDLLRAKMLINVYAGKRYFVQFDPSTAYGDNPLKVLPNSEGYEMLLTADMKNIDIRDKSLTAIVKNEKENGFVEVEGIADAQTQTETSVIYRGGDPLKGLNVSSAKSEMLIGNYYALIVGVDNYSGDWTPLQNAVNDAVTIEKVLRENYKFDHFKALYNEQATRSNIINEFEWLVANVKVNDNVFIYYSGHGDYKQELNKGYWVPVDATTKSTSQFISNNDIQTFLGGIKSKHTLLVADACFSGDIFRGSTVSVPYENSEKYYAKVHDLTSRQAISSGGIEPVMDGGQDGHSVFAYYLLKTLRSNTSKYLDASQVYSNIKIPITNNSEQSPNFSPIKNTGDEGGQFIFIKK